MKQSIIFLDIDGVLCLWGTPEHSKYNQKYVNNTGFHSLHEEPVKQLHRIVKETGAKIVISSDWRKYNWGKLLIHLDYYGIKPIDKTTQKISSEPRAYLINNYIHEHNIKNYVIIDDLDYGFPKDRFIHTDEKTGLIEKLADNAIDILQIKED